MGKRQLLHADETVGRKTACVDECGRSTNKISLKIKF